MSFFLNPFSAEFKGVWNLGDRQHSPEFKVPPNAGRGDSMVIAWNQPPYDLSGNDADGNNNKDLRIVFAIDGEFNEWVERTIDITVTAASASAVTGPNIVTDLNNDTTFSSFFVAELTKFDGVANKTRLIIRSLRDSTRIKFFIHNGRAESVIRFNERAGIAELPSYFSRHRLGNGTAGGHVLTSDRFTFVDGVGMLIELDPDAAGGVSALDTDLIDDATDHKGNLLNLDSAVVRADYELLKGQSGLFNFQKITLDANGNIAQIIEYPAGAKAGDMARKICYWRNGGAANANPYQITEEPYVLASADLIVPDCSEATDSQTP